MCKLEKRYKLLEEKLDAMQKNIDSGFRAWINEDTKAVFMKKYDKRKDEANEILQKLLSEED